MDITPRTRLLLLFGLLGFVERLVYEFALRKTCLPRYRRHPTHIDIYFGYLVIDASNMFLSSTHTSAAN